MSRFLITASMVLLLVMAGSVVVAQGPGQGGQGSGPGGQGWGHGDGFGKGPRGGGAIHKLNRALQAAGAEALGPAQEECIAGEVEAFRTRMREFQGDGSGLALHQAYAQAVLNGDSAAIPGLAEDMALLMAEHMQRRLITQAEFQIQLQNNCLTETQMEALRSLDPKQQAWLVSPGREGLSSVRAQRRDGARNRAGRN